VRGWIPGLTVQTLQGSDEKQKSCVQNSLEGPRGHVLVNYRFLLLNSKVSRNFKTAPFANRLRYQGEILGSSRLGHGLQKSIKYRTPKNDSFLVKSQFYSCHQTSHMTTRPKRVKTSSDHLEWLKPIEGIGLPSKRTKFGKIPLRFHSFPAKKPRNDVLTYCLVDPRPNRVKMSSDCRQTQRYFVCWINMGPHAKI